jgi:diguanylate cyclase (GGDEF)-like protein
MNYVDRKFQAKRGKGKVGRSFMKLNLGEVFDDYPNPMYIIKPIVVNGKPVDFFYMYANRAFCIFLGLSRDELVGHRFTECFKITGEKVWLNAFLEAATEKKHVFIDDVSTVINRRMYSELFHIEPDMCGCIIHDFDDVPETFDSKETKLWRQTARCDYLTGFYNRHYLNELSDKITAGENFGITYIDINNLKEVNDSLGHAVGDELIVHVSELIREHYEHSKLFRVGGDEFVIITKSDCEEDFLRLSEEAAAIFAKDNLAAIGYSFFEKIDDLNECIDKCDRLMYEEKRRMKMMI